MPAVRDDPCRAAGGRVELTGSTVTRGLVLLERDESDELVMVSLVATVVICRCRRCKARFRVLPCDALPRKTYGLAVIEHEVSQYSRGDQSLRQVAWGQLGERTPVHTTLCGWTEGLGAHVLGRPGGDLGGAPMSRFVADAKPRVPEVVSAMGVDAEPDPRRYRSDPRRDRLSAVIRTMAVVRAIAGMEHPHAMADCRRLALLWSDSSVFMFPSRLLCTAIEHRDRSDPARSRAPPKRSRDRCQIHTKSPPGASFKSPP